MKFTPKEKYKELESKLSILGKLFGMDATSPELAPCKIGQVAKAYKNQDRFETSKLCAIQYHTIIFSFRTKDSKDVLQYGTGKSDFYFRTSLVLTAFWAVHTEAFRTFELESPEHSHGKCALACCTLPQDLTSNRLNKLD